MASYKDHINQANNNLRFLESINLKIGLFWDWQVTVCFYTAVHLINAHISNKSNQHYRSHELVNNAINPFNQTSITKLSEEEYTSYIKLQNLSRRARYLVHEDSSNKAQKAFLTYDKHFSKAIKHLDRLLIYISNEYKENFDKVSLNCIELKSTNLKNFKLK